MTLGPVLVGLVVFLTPATVTAQEAIFSHRAYAATGRSYQQLWVWTPDGHLEALTNAPRDHQLPTCEDHGQSVLFNSQDDENGFIQTRWRLDRASGREELVGPGADYPPRPENPSGASATCEARSAVRSPDGTRFACTVKNSGGAVVFIAEARGAPLAQVPIDVRYTAGEPYPDPPEYYLWAPDGRSLLAVFYGEDGGSTNLDAQDYFVLDLHTKKWTRAFFGTGGLWLTPRVILYVTARDLSPLTPGSKRSVWTSHLTAYDPVTHSSRALTSGVSNDLDPVLCER